uniref:hypothetical protein orf163 n=1 Tax=Pterosiphonia complanata TaxID=884089 RepID=UPI0022FD5C5E|nr:hypothetical protein orf163 [Pterosiphonia complanata]WAX03005.1 hypothetical protein orf163 [Pterosiphonia complanata]
MSDSVIVLHVYLLIILIFLFIFSFFISKQLLLLLLNNLKILSLSSNLKKHMSLNKDNYIALFHLYIFRGNLFLSVALSELMLEINHEFTKKDLVYAFLAYSYDKNSFYSISEYYYLMILSFSPYNHEVILNLANMYFDLHYETKANNFFMRATRLNSDSLSLK